MIERKEALSILNCYIKEKKLLHHSYAVEAIMRALAKKINKNVELWGLVGLLHDLDYEYTDGNPESHADLSAKLLEGLLPENALNAIRSHNFVHTEYSPTTHLDKALLAADAVSGLIIATALVMPSKRIKDVTVSSLMKKYKDASFAKNCDRNRIEFYNDIGINKDEFFFLSIGALHDISDTLNL